MFENAITILVMSMKRYNREVSAGNIEGSVNALAQYEQTKHIMSAHNHNFEIETTPVDCPTAIDGKNFLFTKLKLASEYAEKYPILKVMGFEINDAGCAYTFNPKGW